MHRGSSADPSLDAEAARGAGPRGLARRCLRSFIARADDRRLERTVCSGPGLRVLFTALERAYVPARAGDLDAEVAFVLRTADGRSRPWLLSITPQRARARPGVATAPALRVILTLADLARVAAAELDPGTALLTGRLDLEGDFELATRLGALFGLGPL